MHVLYVIDSLARGGAESSLAAMAPGLVARGVRLDVVTLIPRPGVQDALLRAGATVTELSGSRRTWWRQVHTLVRDLRPDLVHTTLFEADLAGRIAARLAGVPVVSTLAAEAYGGAHRGEHRDRRLRLRAAQLADAATARLTTRLHAVSSHVADVMARRLRYPRARIQVIPRGRDAEVLGTRSPRRRALVRARLGIDPDVPLVIAVARHEHAKGLDVLVTALPAIRSAVPSTRVLVAGQPGNATEALERRLAASGQAGALTLLGVRDDVADLLGAADVFVLPSRREGLPGALIEAMALECPAVVSDLPTIRELVDPSTAVLVPPEDSTALAAAIVDTLSNPTPARARAVTARRRFLHEFTIERVVDRMVTFYRATLDVS